MQRALMVSACAARAARAARPQLVKVQVARFSMDGTAFESKRRATEEQYFAKLAEEQRRKFAERLHEKELKELLQVLPPNHNLSADALHDLLEWKHSS